MCVGIWSKLGYVEDDDLKSVTAQAELEGEEELLDDGWDRIIIE
jgi:hypothetical protein